MGHALDNTLQDILIRYKDVEKIYGYEFDGYWSNINTVDSYYRCNMDFLKKDIRHYFEKEPAIKSKTEDLPSAKFNEGSVVKNALISSGCIINGEIEDSVLCKKVFVGKGAVVKNSIIMNDVYIGDGAVIENCIVESHERIPGNAEFIGEAEEPKIVRLKN